MRHKGNMQTAAQGIKDVSIQDVMPVLFGVLTCDTLEQAEERCRPDETNSGYQAALAAVRMVGTFREIAA